MGENQKTAGSLDKGGFELENGNGMTKCNDCGKELEVRAEVILLGGCGEMRGRGDVLAEARLNVRERPLRVDEVVRKG